MDGSGAGIEVDGVVLGAVIVDESSELDADWAELVEFEDDGDRDEDSAVELGTPSLIALLLGSTGSSTRK